MPRLLSNGFFRVLFDMNPNPMIVICSDGRVKAANPAANSLFCIQSDTKFPLAGGDLLQCVNAKNGCGCSPVCINCILRKSFNQAMSDQNVHRQKGKFVTQQSENLEEFTFLITAKKLMYHRQLTVLIIFEDISLISELSGLLPICSYCHKIRDEDGNWTPVAQYLRSHSEAEFSHDCCPSCMEEVKKLRRTALAGGRRNFTVYTSM